MSLITVAGYAAVLYLVAKLLTYLSKYVRSPLDVNKLGDWSLVTGATDGIGRKNNKYGSVWFGLVGFSLAWLVLV